MQQIKWDSPGPLEWLDQLELLPSPEVGDISHHFFWQFKENQEKLKLDLSPMLVHSSPKA